MPKSSLMLAGGGVKIAFQAGVLQVLLDEAGIEFDRGDAVSAACFNLAMWVQGMSGTEIADNWRNTPPFSEVDLNTPQLARLFYAASIFDLNAFRRTVFPAWKLDWSKIRSSTREATFNVYNFSKHELRAIPASDLTEDLLVASASLPMWFPPVKIDGDTYIDAVFNIGTNIGEAIRSGADELWVIWTTSQRGEWFDGFVGNFFGIFEATEVGSYKSALARIAANNRALERGEIGEFGRTITVKEIRAEVPVHYLLNFSQDRAAECVNRGVETARQWCDAAGIKRRTGPVYIPAASVEKIGVRFSETLKGFVGFSATEFEGGFEQGKGEGTALTVHLDVFIENLDEFLALPEHRSRIQGSIECARMGGTRPIDAGTLRLLVDSGDPSRKQIKYQVSFSNASGTAYEFSAEKDLIHQLQDDPWQEVSTAFVKLCASAGHGNETSPVAVGIIRSSFLGEIEQVASLRVEAPTAAARAHALARFGAFYFGRLWDVYARHLLPVAPF
jgi:predicted acylesterase/phospholipase RssA